MKEALIKAIQDKDILSIQAFINSESRGLLVLPLEEENGFHAIHFAVESGYLPTVKLILEAYPESLNQTTFFGYTPLMLAAYYSRDTLRSGNYAYSITRFTTGVYYPGIIDHLLTFKEINLYAKVNRPRGAYHGYRALDWISHPDVGEQMKAHGAISGKVVDLDHADPGIEFILRARDLDKLKQFLENHPDLLEKKDKHGVSLLQLSFYMNLQVFEYLTERFASNSTLNSHVARISSDLNRLPTHSSLQYLKILITYNFTVDELRWGSDRQPLTHIAIGHQDHEFLQLLVKHNRERLDQVDGLGRTPLMYAIDQRSIACIQSLLDAGANQHYASNEYAPAIYHAARASLDMFALFDKTIYVAANQRIENQQHLVHVACENVLKKLLDDYPYLIDVRDNMGYSLLLKEMLHGDHPNLSKIQLLLSKKANLEFIVDDPDSKYYGFTALEIAKDKVAYLNVWNDVVRILILAGARDESLLRARTGEPVIKAAPTLVSKVTDVPSMSYDRDRLFSSASKESHTGDSTGLRLRSRGASSLS